MCARRSKAGKQMGLKIGELARQTGSSVATLRFYEKEGLLPPPQRTEGNYRLYEGSAVQRVNFILHCRLLGFSLDEIRTLLSFRDNPCSGCGWINTLVEKHIAHIEMQIAALQHFKKHFENLRFRCDGSHAGDCGILESLDKLDMSCCRQVLQEEETAQKSLRSGPKACGCKRRGR